MPPRQSDLELRPTRADFLLDLRIVRCGWVVFALSVLAALSGLLGRGPLSSATSGEAGASLRAEYHRFGRYEGPTELRLHINPELAHNGTLRIWIDRRFLEALALENVLPQPDTVELGTDRHTYVFAAPKLGGQTAITFRYKPTVKFRTVPVRLGTEDGPELAFWQFVYP
ncbi:hypothetical protein [Roseomonas chloroacetimidivorans]|uniref:hypothetical protein n=1 Tax=Roseomonas chloroacetimidivorans TaxID=1766656 RepID=UPI003C74DDA1